MNATQKQNCRMIRRNVKLMHRMLDEIEKALDPQERHVLASTIDDVRTFALKHLLADALQFAKADDGPEDHLDDETFLAWERAGSPTDVAAWLATFDADEEFATA